MTSQERDGTVVEYDHERGTYRARFETETECPSTALVEAVSAAEQIETTAMEPLGYTTDLGALDALVRSSADDCEIQLSLPDRGYRATIQSDGLIELRPTDSVVQPRSEAE